MAASEEDSRDRDSKSHGEDLSERWFADQQKRAPEQTDPANARKANDKADPSRSPPCDRFRDHHVKHEANAMGVRSLLAYLCWIGI